MPEYCCVSVIVPFYNAEPYLKRCIDVLLKQDFNKSFEIIMVDDASTDRG
jgi:glycosyltransferase involved in cell wall biosynthesis